MLIEIRADNTVHIEGYVNAVERDSNIINVPSVGRCVEQIRAGVFDKALSSGADVSILENHDNSRRLGSISEGNLKLYEDNIGLRASADITDIEIVGKARRGELKGWSFGFICTDSEIEQRAGNVPRRIVKGMSLSEVSLIDGDYKPCYNGTLVEVRSEGNFIEYRAGIDETVEVNTPTESADMSTDAENAPVDSTADGETVENRSETPDYSYYDAMLRYLELRYNPYHDPGNGRFCSGGGGGGGINSVLYIPQGHAGVYKGNKAAMQKSMSSASQQASERIKAMGGTVDENGRYSFQEHGGLMMIQGQTGAAPTTTINVQTGNVVSQATNSSGDLTNPGNSGTIESDKYGNMSRMIAHFKDAGVKYNPVKSLDAPLSEQEIIDRIGGGDLTKGSCASLALTYAANKAGYDVLDFRGGESLNTVANSRKYADMIHGVDDMNGELYWRKGRTKTIEHLKNNLSDGDECIFHAAAHAAIVRKNGKNLEYLELQCEPGVKYKNNAHNGWNKLTCAALGDRFGCDSSLVSFDYAKIEDISKSTGFKEMMGYINTPASEQQKGRGGHAK